MKFAIFVAIACLVTARAADAHRQSGQLDDKRDANPQTLLTIETSGKAAPTDTTIPDGVAFEGSADGSAVAHKSRLVCPTDLGVFHRSSLFTTGAADGGEEVGCRYASETGRLLVVETRARPGQSAKDALPRMSAAIKAASVGEPASKPIPTEGPPGVVGVGSFFETRDGAAEAFYGTRLASWWFLEVYVRYPPGDEAAVAAAITAFSKANEDAP